MGISCVVGVMGSISGMPKVVGICDDCGGRIVRKVQGFYGGEWHYHNPACKKCYKVYRGVEDAQKDHSDYEKHMNTHYGM